MSDARLNSNIIIHREYPTIGGLEITYPALLTLKGESNPYAKLFHSFLDSDTSRNILNDYGFLTGKS
jgi:ABC-type molybdate transport system substrate-binding protein